MDFSAQHVARMRQGVFPPGLALEGHDLSFPVSTGGDWWFWTSFAIWGFPKTARVLHAPASMTAFPNADCFCGFYFVYSLLFLRSQFVFVMLKCLLDYLLACN
jgi:hypothetical protein